MTQTLDPKANPTASVGADSLATRAGTRARIVVRTLFPVDSRSTVLLAATTVLITVFGLIMVFSATFVEASTSGGNFFFDALKQAAFAAIGLGGMFIAARFRPAFWKKFAWAALGIAIVLQAIVFTPLGYAIGGNRNWFAIGGVSMQPSEFVKAALVMWLAMILTQNQQRLTKFVPTWTPIVVCAGVPILLVVLGHDFGTATILVAIVFGAMWFAGAKIWHLLVPIGIVVLVSIPVLLSSQSRIDRMLVFLRGCTEEDYWNGCWQQQHGTWALANGGLFGVGLGNSRAKWNWLPAAGDDYIFAIVGEELGLIGAMVLLGLFLLLGYALLRIVREARQPFTRIAAGALATWVVGQALVNIAVVLGLLPVLGVPLPLVSSGGSALIATLGATGFVIALARADHPGAADDAQSSANGTLFRRFRLRKARS